MNRNIHITHKVAISNYRIQNVTQHEVSFNYKNYRDAGKAKTITLSNEEFTRRFAQHLLPHRFVRIRHYGILSSSWKRGKLQALQQAFACEATGNKAQNITQKLP